MVWEGTEFDLYLNTDTFDHLSKSSTSKKKNFLVMKKKLNSWEVI